jgi:hypothetical protein
MYNIFFKEHNNYYEYVYNKIKHLSSYIDDLKMIYNLLNIILYLNGTQKFIYKIKYEDLKDYSYDNIIKILNKIKNYNSCIDILLKIIKCKNKFFILYGSIKYLNVLLNSTLKYTNYIYFNLFEELIKYKNIDIIPDDKLYYLTINDKKVNKINGPTTMYILKPKEKYYKYKLPLLMLFGDLHFSKDNQCICRDDEECKNIQNTFLELINDIKINDREDKKIKFTYDLYIETSNIDLKYKKKQDIYIGPLHDISYNYCFTNKKLCKYKNINWHYVDLRFNVNNNIINDILNKQYFEDIIYSIYDNLIENKNLDKIFKDIKYIKTFFYAYILYINNIYLKNINYDELF